MTQHPSRRFGPLPGPDGRRAGNGCRLLSVLLPVVLWATAAVAQAPRSWNGFDWNLARAGRWQLQARYLQARQGGSLFLQGEVHARGPDTELWADWLEIHPPSERVVAGGRVRLVQGRAVLEARRLELDGKLSRAMVAGARILLRNRPPPADAYSDLQLSGRRLDYADGLYRLREARVTACDCGPDERPSWELAACRAQVEPDQGAWLEWPVLYLKGVPVLGLPLLYLPLAERRSGLLFPRINYSGRDGFVLGEDLYLTLGRSADLTLGVDWFEERGPRLGLEFRARPGNTSGLQARLRWLDDEKVGADERRGPLHQRLDAEFDAWWHERDFTWTTALRLFSDSDQSNDFLSELTGRAADAAQSGSLFGWRSGGWLLEASLAYAQDLRFSGVDLLAERTRPVEQGLPADTIQRLGALAVHSPAWRPGAGPVELSFWAELANLSSLAAAWRDWGTDGVPDEREPAWEGAQTADRSADDVPGPEGNGRLDDGELRRALRLLLQPRLTARFFPGPLGMEFSAWHRQLVYLPHGPGAPAATSRGLSFASLYTWSVLGRSLGSNWQHRLRPWLQLAGAWQGLASDGARPYLDGWDRLLADSQQLVLGLDNLLRHGPAAWRLQLRLFAGFDLRRVASGPLGGRLEVTGQWLELRLEAQLDTADWSLADLEAGLRLRPGRWLTLQADYLYLASRRDAAGLPLPAADRFHGELGLPLAPGLTPLVAVSAGLQALVLQARTRLGGGWSLWSGALLDLNAPDYAWLGGGLAYRSPCRCWGFALTVRHNRGQDIPDIFFALDLGRLGRAALGTAQRF